MRNKFIAYVHIFIFIFLVLSAVDGQTMLGPKGGLTRSNLAVPIERESLYKSGHTDGYHIGISFSHQFEHRFVLNPEIVYQQTGFQTGYLGDPETVQPNELMGSLRSHQASFSFILEYILFKNIRLEAGARASYLLAYERSLLGNTTPLTDFLEGHTTGEVIFGIQHTVSEAVFFGFRYFIGLNSLSLRPGIEEQVDFPVQNAFRLHGFSLSMGYYFTLVD